MGGDIGTLLEQKEISIETLSGKKIAIDANNTLYQFLSIIRQPDGTLLKDSMNRVTSHLSGLIYRTVSLVEYGLKPIFVFDGKFLPLKEKVLRERRKRREEAQRKWEEAKGKSSEEAFKYAQAATRIDASIIKDTKTLLTYMGIPYVEAAAEGEAQAAYIVRRGDADAASSQDYDTLLFGSPLLIRNLGTPKKEIRPAVIELREIEEKSGISREQFVDIAILSGTDFNEGIRGIGAKRALKLIKKHGSIEKVIEEIGEEKVQGIENYELIRDIFLHPEVNEAYEIKWRMPDEEKIKDFLCEEHDFSEERVNKALARMRKRMGLAMQRNLESWL